MTNTEYWRERAIEREAYWYEQATEVLQEQVKLYYQQSLSAIERDIAALYGKYAGENGLTMTEARRLIRGEEFKTWRMTLEEYVQAATLDSAILKELNTLAMRSRISRFEALHARTLMEIANLCEKLNQFEDALNYRAYVENYYGTLYDIHKTIGLSAPPVIVSAAQVEKVLRTKWVGPSADYSKLIWTNGEKLAVELKDTMTQAIHRGLSIQKLSQNLSRRMEVAYNNAERLVRTELNFIQTKSSLDSIESAGLEHYQFIAALDNRRCPRCGGLDGKVIPLEEKMQGENAPPIHPRCRCTICAALGENLPVKKSARRAKREKVPDISYAEWKARYVEKAQTQNVTQSLQVVVSGSKTPTFDLQTFAGQRLPEGDYNLRIRQQVQNRHTEGTREYQDYVKRLSEKNLMPSKMSPNIDVQALVNEFHGRGIYDPNSKDNSPREQVDVGKTIGQYWNNRTGSYVDTSWIEIVYSKKGTHVYPIRPKED